MLVSGRSRYRRSQRGASQIAEFIPAIYVLFLIVFMPLLNLSFLFVSAAIQYLATNDFAVKASTQGDYQTALSTMASEAFTFQGNGLAKFVTLVPHGGYIGCGNDLFLVTTNIASGASSQSQADMPLSQAVDTKANIYEISVQSTYSISPIINLSSVPILGEVPGLGQPVVLSFTANRPIEHPSGFQMIDPNAGNNNVAAVTPFNRTSVGIVSPVSTNVTWRDPTIYDQIKAQGQTVVADNVFIVDPNNANWTPSGVVISPGQKIWVDTQAVGQWQSPGLAFYDANGIPNNNGCNGVQTVGAPFASLVAVVGVTGPIQASTPNSFFVGNNQINLQPTGTGPLCMSYNDWSFGGCQGQQMVRVIVAQ